MPLPLPRRRTLAKIGLFLLAGAVVNVGIVWRITASQWLWYAPNGLGSAPPALEELLPPDWPNLTHFVTSHHFGRASVIGWTGPDSEVGGVSCAEWEAALSREGYQIDPYRVHAAYTTVGYPLKSMWCVVLSDDRDWIRNGYSGRAVIGGVDIPGGSPMPMRPIWPLFIADSLVWAFITWGVTTMVIVPIWVRVGHTLREASAPKWIARGLCPRCRYDIHSLETCPECGETIRRKVAEA